MSEEIKKELNIDDLATFAKRKGFVYSSGEVYGGLSGFWDFGPLGVEIINNLKKSWWRYHVHMRDDVVGIDGSIITNPKVWEASGHVAHFVDVAVKNPKTKEIKKVDPYEIKNGEYTEKGVKYEVLGEVNPMFTTQIGSSSKDSTKAYLRPETAQSIFSQFKSIVEHARLTVPFGIAQIGKAFRNEIAPREFLFRCREFEQMELEYFIKKEMPCPYMDEIKDVSLLVYTAEMQKQSKEPKVMKIVDAYKKKIISSDWHAYWIAKELQWFIDLGANKDKFRARQHVPDEKSHYALDTWDLEFEFPMGWRELQGFANRGSYDLEQHAKAIGKPIELLDTKDNKKFVPDVVCEPSLGVGRAFIVFMLSAYVYDPKRENVVLKLHPKLAPFQAAVLPIISKGEVHALANEVSKNLKKEFVVAFDDSGSIGRRYSRNDEIGTPYCIAVDQDSIKGKDVTIRDRNTTKQIRVKISDLSNVLHNLISDDLVFEKTGKIVETRVK